MPVTAQNHLDLTLVGTDSTGLSASASFNLTFVSLPYLAKPLQNYQTRTLVLFSCSIPRGTIVSPDGDRITYNVS